MSTKETPKKSTLGAERLNRLIDETRTKISALETGAIAELDTAMAIDFDEHFQFQQLQAQAHVSERLSPEAAQVVYAALGEVGSSNNGGWAAKTDTATKVIITQLMREMLELKIAGRF